MVCVIVVSVADKYLRRQKPRGIVCAEPIGKYADKRRCNFNIRIGQCARYRNFIGGRTVIKVIATGYCFESARVVFNDDGALNGKRSIRFQVHAAVVAYVCVGCGVGIMAGADRDTVERKRCVVVDENSADVSVAVVCRGFIAFYHDVFKRNVRADTCIDSARRTGVCNRRIIIGNRSADHRQFTVIPNSDTACSNTCIAFDIDVG